MQRKRDKSSILNSVLRQKGSAGRIASVRVIRDDLWSVLEPESRGYDPYDRSPPPPANEHAAGATLERRLFRKSRK